MPPTRVSDVAPRDKFISVYSLEGIAEALRGPEYADGLLVCVRDDDDRHTFVLPACTTTEEAQARWDWQLEVVAHDVQFHIEVRGRWDRGRRGLHQHIYVQTLFEEGHVPEGVRENPALPGTQLGLIVRVDAVEDPPDKIIGGATEEVHAWLRALTIGCGVGITVLGASVNPVYRHYPSMLLGAEEAQMVPVRASAGASLHRRITDDPGAWALVDQLNAALTAGSVADGIRILWHTLEQESRRTLDPLVSSKKRREIRRYLRDALGAKAEAEAVTAVLAALEVRPLTSWVAELLADIRDDLDESAAEARVAMIVELVQRPIASPVPSEEERRAFDDLFALVRSLLNTVLGPPPAAGATKPPPDTGRQFVRPSPSRSRGV